MADTRDQPLDLADLPDEAYGALEHAAKLAPTDRAKAVAAIEDRHSEWRSHIRAYLRAADASDSQLDRLIQHHIGLEPPNEASPDAIAGYQIVRKLGEGGMGTVYLAEEGAPLHRRVALKVIRRGMDSRRILRRFESERRILAKLDHGCIAAIHDAGDSRQGPFFTMDYVDGLPITHFCDDRRVGIEERIRLFARVCEAVAHAHEQGVLHRDLKPSNIIVSDVNGSPYPKVIDFGLARAMDQEPEEERLTVPGTTIGTPEYMAPEVTASQTSDSTEQADVYALGIILHELLVGALPDPGKAPRTHGTRALENAPPKRPSDLVLKPRATALAESRSTTPTALRAALRGGLDWIVMRAIEPSCKYRYPEVEHLRTDLLNHLAGHGVNAGPRPLVDRLVRFVQRNTAAWLAVASLSIVAAVTWNTLGRDSIAAIAPLTEAEIIALTETLDRAETKLSALYCDPPIQSDALRRWFGEDYASATDAFQRIRSELSRLCARAEPSLETQREAARQTHPGFSQLQLLRDQQAWFRRWGNMVSGKERPAELELSNQQKLLDMEAARAAAEHLVAARRRIYGREAEGLALARHALSQPIPMNHWAEAHSTLAWALHANGQPGAANDVLVKSLRTAPDLATREQVLRQRMLLRSATAKLNDPEVLGQHGRRIADLEHSTVPWRWSSEADRRRGDRLIAILPRIRQLERLGRRARDRLEWTNKLFWLTRAHPRARATWAEANRAVLMADGATASTLYSGARIDLQPQRGLVPIGMNPQTRLWEFYHLRSAWFPDEIDAEDLEIPTHAPDGSVELNEFTGLVFVLLPGGDVNFRTDGKDQVASVPPFFVSRYEMTQGQWRRLARNNPSTYPYPHLVEGQQVRGSNPVENVSWHAARTTLAQFGLQLPTHRQWLFSARAGTTTPWHCGNNAASLEGAANLLDRDSHPEWGGERVPWHDSHVVHAPVGSFEPNGFGLYDIHGNVWELCRDEAEPSHRVICGGCFGTSATGSRLDDTKSIADGNTMSQVGIRPIRPLQQ